MMPNQPSIEVSEEAVELAFDAGVKPLKPRRAREDHRKTVREMLEAAAPAIVAKAVEAERERLAHGGEPDISPGDVIAAEPDGTITLDDGITTWNPARANAFLVRQAIQKERERIEGALRAWLREAQEKASSSRRRYPGEHVAGYWEGKEKTIWEVLVVLLGDDHA